MGFHDTRDRTNPGTTQGILRGLFYINFKNLEILILTRNNMGFEEAMSLADTNLPHLKELYLDVNRLDDKSIEITIKWVVKGSKKLTNLNLNENHKASLTSLAKLN